VHSGEEPVPTPPRTPTSTARQPQELRYEGKPELPRQYFKFLRLQEKGIRASEGLPFSLGQFLRGPDITDWEKKMNSTLINLYVKFQGLKNGEEGQDLVEYALLVALIALGCISATSNVATAINTVFQNISTTLA
jgi:pilus assembly protein Flp/PilA